jgi:septal ring factor EnvC (AmiA/AmiB activator)
VKPDPSLADEEQAKQLRADIERLRKELAAESARSKKLSERITAVERRLRKR